MRFKFIVVITALAVSVPSGWAGDVLTIKIPRHSELTPVQRLNREGVDAVKKHQYDRAAAIFYKAYLYDPADPFTLNNLGYISELHGELEHARQFYKLATMQESNANIDISSAKQLEGKPMLSAFEGLQDGPMRVDRINLEALNLLSQNRSAEAVVLLRQARAAAPNDPFTLNNLGVSYEATGEYDDALKAYRAAAASDSAEQATLTLDRQSRGKQISVMAATSAKRLNERMQRMGSEGASAVMLTARGVTAANQNNWLAARQDFLDAYFLDPSSAFSLNNRGYVAEMDGDLETAEFFYGKARRAGDADARVGLATQRLAEGKRLFAVATESNRQVDGQIEKYSLERRLEKGPIELTPREDGAAGHNSAPLPQSSPSDGAPAPQLQ
jgi:Flp pilus assembly protein TadD